MPFIPVSKAAEEARTPQTQLYSMKSEIKKNKKSIWEK